MCRLGEPASSMLFLFFFIFAAPTPRLLLCFLFAQIQSHNILEPPLSCHTHHHLQKSVSLFRQGNCTCVEPRESRIIKKSKRKKLRLNTLLQRHTSDPRKRQRQATTERHGVPRDSNSSTSYRPHLCVTRQPGPSRHHQYQLSQNLIHHTQVSV